MGLLRKAISPPPNSFRDDAFVPSRILCQVLPGVAALDDAATSAAGGTDGRLRTIWGDLKFGHPPTWLAS